MLFVEYFALLFLHLQSLHHALLYFKYVCLLSLYFWHHVLFFVWYEITPMIIMNSFSLLVPGYLQSLCVQIFLAIYMP